MIGVNLSGAEFGKGHRYGYDYMYPAAKDLDYFASKGVDLIRLPVKWERLQTTLGGELDAVELGRLRTFLDLAEARDLRVIVDLHNYGRYGGNSIGSDKVTVSQFSDFWSKLATSISGHDALWGYDIMNEPHDMGAGSNWPKAAQSAVDAIRAVDTKTAILVEGTAWSSASNWQKYNANLDIMDPTGNLYYEAHQYFDKDSTGTYKGSFDDANMTPELAIQRLEPFLQWLEQNNAKGFLGEFGVPSNDPRWIPILDAVMDRLEKADVSGALWGGGSWWNSSYPLALSPVNGVDRPQIAALEKHLATIEDTRAAIEAPVVWNKILVGTDNADKLEGGSGNDFLSGGRGNDILVGKEGGDLLKGGAGVDTFKFEPFKFAGNDDYISDFSMKEGDKLDNSFGRVAFTAARFADAPMHSADAQNDANVADLAVVMTSEGKATRTVWLIDAATEGGLFDFQQYFANQSVAAKSGGILPANAVSTQPVIANPTFPSTINGTAKSEKLDGTVAADVMFGGGGDDQLIGKGGNDLMFGGAGADTFKFDTFRYGGAVDYIGDFSLADKDKLQGSNGKLKFEIDGFGSASINDAAAQNDQSIADMRVRVTSTDSAETNTIWLLDVGYVADINPFVGAL